MFRQLDKEMEKRKIDTAVVVGESTLGNPELAYIAGTPITRGGVFVKRRGHDPLLVVSHIDVGNAKRGRIRNVRTYSDYGYEKLLKQYGPQRGYIMLIDLLLQSVHTQGRVSIYGRDEFSHLLSVADYLRRIGYKVAGERNGSLIESLRETKDAEEINRIRKVGLRSARVVEGILEMLRQCTISSGKLRLKKKILTIGTVKSRINALLAEQDLIAPEGSIFAVGPSSADPHNEGAAADPVRQGAPIVFDLFPVGDDGYWFDLTRTYVVGRASSKVRRMFEIVHEVQASSLDLIEEGMPASDPMSTACEIFERHGFKTIRAMLKGDKSAAREGFVHSLGHGVGLTIGERPNLSLFSDDMLKRSQVVTVEPGLYKPGVGGVRIEDTIVIKGRGIDNLTPLEKDLKI